jgi:hypothetical protein
MKPWGKAIDNLMQKLAEQRQQEKSMSASDLSRGMEMEAVRAAYSKALDAVLKIEQLSNSDLVSAVVVATAGTLEDMLRAELENLNACIKHWLK